MANDNDMSFVPDYLLDALALDQETGSLDLFSDRPAATPKLRRVEIPQRTSNKHSGNLGKIFISGLTSEDEGTYVDTLDFLLVASLVWNASANNALPDDLAENKILKGQLNGGIGGMTMWEFNDKGERVTDATAPICSSPNGVQVWNNLIGKDVKDYRTGRAEKIGFDLTDDGLYVKREHSCVGCPFQQWITVDTGNVDATGKAITQSYQPMCRQTFSWLIWSVDHQELMTLKAVNVGMQMALNGAYSKTGRRYDDVPFKNIERYFSATGSTTLPNGTTVATFANRPLGRPSVDNPSAPVFAVRMTATANNFSPASVVPQLTILDGKSNPIIGINQKGKKGWMDGTVTFPADARPLTAQEYTAYLAAMQTAVVENYRSKFMATNIIHHKSDNDGVAAHLPSGEVAAPSLSSGAVIDPTAQNLDDPFAFAK